MYANVNKTDGSLIPVAGGTLYADTPVGAWIKWDDQTNLPDGYLKAGDTISQSEYPEVYAKYGSTVPYKADDSELSDWEDITIGTSNVTMAYDGFVIGKWSLSNNRGEFTVNDTIVFSTANSASGVGELEIPVKKGDTIKQTGSTTTASLIKARFYKKSLIVKAKQTPMPADFMNAVEEAIDTSNLAKVLPYSFIGSLNIAAFNRKFVKQGSSITWTATHTGRLTLRFLKAGDGYSLYLRKNGYLVDSYDNFFGTDNESAGCTQASITLVAWVKKGESVYLESNLPSATASEQTFFCQTGLLAYNPNYD